MRPLIEQSEWLFALVKSGTLVATWAVMAWYANHNRAFVDKACWVGSILYLGVWTIWLAGAHLGSGSFA